MSVWLVYGLGILTPLAVAVFLHIAHIGIIAGRGIYRGVWLALYGKPQAGATRRDVLMRAHRIIWYALKTYLRAEYIDGATIRADWTKAKKERGGRGPEEV